MIQQAWFVGNETAAVILYAGACRLCRMQSGSVMLGAFEDAVAAYAFCYISVWWVLHVSFRHISTSTFREQLLGPVEMSSK